MATDEQALILKMSADISGMQKQMNAAIGVVDSSSRRMELRSKEAAAAIEKSYGTINVESFGAMLAETAKLQDRLSVAQLDGNTAEAKALREQILLQGQLQKAALAQLETQLAIARASGNKAQVVQITEALAVQRQLSRLQGVGLTGTKALHEAETAVVALAAAEKAAEGANIGRALDKVFDSSKLTLMDEGATKIRIFGSALEPLGAIGIGAAVGIVAVAVAAEQVHKAMEWADELQRTADKLGTTTTSLQQFDYASVATSIGLQQGREALAQFNEKVGAFESHIRDKSMEKFANGVHLTRQEVSQAVDPIDKLRLVLEKIATLPDAPQRSAGAKAFGLEGLLPIVNQGSEGIDKFIGKMKEARENGSIVDPRAVKEAAELNDKVEELSFRIGQDLKSAFIGAAPAVEQMAQFLERCAHALANFSADVPNALRGLEEIAGRAAHLPAGVHLDQAFSGGNFSEGLTNLTPQGRALGAAGTILQGTLRALTAEGQSARLGDRVNELLSGPHLGLHPGDEPPRQAPGQQLFFDKPKAAKAAKATPADDTLQKTEGVNQALAQADRQLQEALKALTGDIDARAAFERKALQDELAAETSRLQKQKDELDKDKAAGLKAPADPARLDALAAQVKADQDITAEQRDRLLSEIALAKTKRDELKAALDLAAATAASATAAKIELVNRQAAFAIEDRQIEIYKARSDAQLAELQYQAGIATTAKERAAVELRILALRQQFERDLAETAIDRRIRTPTNPGGDLTPEQGAAKKSSFETVQAAQAASEQRKIYFDVHPLAAFIQSAQDFNRIAETAGVQALDNLATGLASAIVNAQSLGDVAKNVFRQMVADLLAAAIRRDIEAPLLQAAGVRLPGAAAPLATGPLSAAPFAAAITGASTTGASAMGLSITTAGTSSATTIAAAMVSAGHEAAGAIASAMASRGGGSSSGGGGGGLLGGLFNFGLGGLGNFGSFDFGSALSGWTGGFDLSLPAYTPKFAEGTPAAPGGPALVGEAGSELIKLPGAHAATPPSGQPPSGQVPAASPAPVAPGVYLVQRPAVVDLPKGAEVVPHYRVATELAKIAPPPPSPMAAVSPQVSAAPTTAMVHIATTPAEATRRAAEGPPATLPAAAVKPTAPAAPATSPAQPTLPPTPTTPPAALAGPTPAPREPPGVRPPVAPIAVPSASPAATVERDRRLEVYRSDLREITQPAPAPASPAAGPALPQADSLARAAEAMLRVVDDLLSTRTPRPAPQLPAYAAGGEIHGPGTGTSDSILAEVSGGGRIRVANGEYIVNAEATRKHKPLLQAINEGRASPEDLARLPKFAAGGMIGPAWPRFADGGLVNVVQAPSLPVLDGLRQMHVPQAAAPVVQQNLAFDLKGAVVTQDLLNQMNAMARQARAGAVGDALRIVNKGFPARSQSLQSLGT